MEPTLTYGSIIVRLVVVVLLVLANGFFVAAEFALVAARRTRIEALVAQGNRRARLAEQAIRHLDRYISGTQLGITLASLALGWVGESTVTAVLVQGFSQLPEPFRIIAAHGVAITISFAIITFLHIVLGELAPKSLALLFPEDVSVWTAGPLIAFSRLLKPFIVFLNGSANLLLRLLGLKPPSEAERVHRPEEIEMLLTQSFAHGLMAREPVEMIRGVFDLTETTAAEVMTPRTEIVALPASASVEEAAALILEVGHSRIPVYQDSLDHIVGVLLDRDVWKAQLTGEQRLADLIRPLSYVPDSKPIGGLLREMQRQRSHIAVVVDEFGGTAGIVTLEDLVEEVVGEIHDEDELEPPEIQETGAGEVVLSGTVAIFDLNERYRLDLPEHEYTTAAGYVLGRLGRIPRVGDEVRFPGGRFRVLQMSGRRVERLELHLEAGAPQAAP
jgi:CBS domain containing-hemolysin-like protein